MAEMVKTDTVTVTIDGTAYEFPKGTNLVDAAKRIDVDIPVFCYHPKMDPVGMCRMCLVELGSVMRDRATGEVVLDDDGNPTIRWFPKLQTACTQIVSDGMHVKTNTQQVIDARNDVLEFILTSHPLDCPVCDKGGECPLQNLTMAHGPDSSRMYFDDKMNLDKHYPLGDLIFLDRERCIQCARCTRFQDEIVGDDVLAFHERGRRLQIITNSEPGFDSYFSGNTTDICPVGALTTDDFRFGARPWELTSVASISPHSAAGTNITLSTRLDRDFGGRAMIKRIMPRQHEQVNEIWISDKDRFGHHFTRDEAMRLLAPLVDGNEVGWDAAYSAVADLLKDGDVAAIAGSGMSNEDLWALRSLLGDDARLGAWPVTHAGADIVAQVGVGTGTNLGDLGPGDAILVIASDLEEEEPIYRLRVKGAKDRGAAVFVANSRPTRMDDFVPRRNRLRYETGDAVNAMLNFDSTFEDAGTALREAENLVILVGAEGVDTAGSRALLAAAANYLIGSGHVGRANNGLIALIPGPNGMGLHYTGYTAEASLDIAANPPKTLVVAQADLLFDDPDAADWLAKVEHIVQLTLFADEVIDGAKAALPIQSFAERDGTFTSAERRVQRFYTGQGPLGNAQPAWQICSRIGEALGKGAQKRSAAAVMLDMTKNIPAFDGMRYKDLAKVEVQYPLVGREDVYYGGTAYDNKGGLGKQIAADAEASDASTYEVNPLSPAKPKKGEFHILPTVELYDLERVFRSSVNKLMKPRVKAAYAELNAADAERLKVADGDDITVQFGGKSVVVRALVNGSSPEGTVLLPRHMLQDAVMPMTLTTGTISK